VRRTRRGRRSGPSVGFVAEKGTEAVRCCWCGADGIASGTPVCPQCKKGIADLLPPDYILRGGRYRVEKALGKGGFGITYRALDTEFERYVAIKEYFPGSYAHRDPNSGSLTVTTDDVQGIQKGLESFRREGRHLARVEHPNIPAVYDRFDENNTSYMVMEFLEGRSIKQLMQGKPLSPEQVTKIMEDLVSALGAVHQHGIHHLDIKPDNVIVQSSGRVVLIDFGAARQGTSFGDTSIAAMTPAYAPLELQARQNYGPETDIFELGMMLHQMLTATLPPSANERLISKQDWEPEGIEEPWRTLIVEATRLRSEDRPKDVRSWWYQTDPEALTDGATVVSPAAVATGVGESGPASQNVSRVTAARRAGQMATAPNAPVDSDSVTRMLETETKRDERRGGANPALIGGGVVGLAALVGIGAMMMGKPGGGTPVASPSAASGVATNPSPAANGATNEQRANATRALLATLNKINASPPGSDAEIKKLAEEVKKELADGADVNTTSDDGTSALHVVAVFGWSDIAKDLVQRGANVNVRDLQARTPLHIAALGDTAAVAKILLASGARMDAEDREGKTPLKLAVESKSPETEKVIRARMKSP
jgi:serine/threonine protein kinase